MKEEAEYDKVFNNDYNRALYVACILIDRGVQEYMKNKSGLPNDVRRDLQYYVAMMVACGLAEKAALTSGDVSALFPTVQAGIPESTLAASCDTAYAVYKELGATAKVSKGPELVARLRKALDEQFPAAT